MKLVILGLEMSWDDPSGDSKTLQSKYIMFIVTSDNNTFLFICENQCQFPISLAFSWENWTLKDCVACSRMIEDRRYLCC